MGADQFFLASIDCLPEIVEVEQRSYSFPWSEGNFRDCFKPGYEVWACRADANLFAYGIISYAAGEAHLLNLCTDVAYRKKGIARSLLKHLTARAMVMGAEDMFLEVRESNISAIALYLSEGFNEIGVRRGYYPNGKSREDAIVMALHLG